MKRAVGMLMLAMLVTSGEVWAASCSVSATGVAFGAYNHLSGSPLDSTGTVTVQCTGGGLLSAKNVSYTIQLNAGSSGSFSPRKLASGANLLDYNLYRNSARTTIWGNGSGGTSTVGGSFTLGNCVLFLLCSDETESRNHTVYGRIPASQNVPAGSYSDTITVTVNY